MRGEKKKQKKKDAYFLPLFLFLFFRSRPPIVFPLSIHSSFFLGRRCIIKKKKKKNEKAEGTISRVTILTVGNRRGRVGAMGAGCAGWRAFCENRRNMASGTNRHCRANIWSASAWAFHVMWPFRAACSVHILFRGRLLCWGYAADQIRT